MKHRQIIAALLCAFALLFTVSTHAQQPYTGPKTGIAVDGTGQAAGGAGYPFHMICDSGCSSGGGDTATAANQTTQITAEQAIQAGVGAIGDAAWDGSGNGSAIAVLKALYAQLASVVTNTTGLATAANQSTAGASLTTIATQTTATAAGVGTAADAAWSGSGNGSAIAVLKALYAKLAGTLTVSGSVSASNATAVNNQGSVTRPANTTPYVANEAVCSSASSNCTPIQIPVARVVTGTGYITHVKLLKSGSGTTNATFAIYFFSATPTVASVHDASTYSGPFAADWANYLGSASCVASNNTSDGTAQVWYECALSNLGSQGLPFVAVSGQQYVLAMIAATGAYTPASGETFTAEVDVAQD